MVLSTLVGWLRLLSNLEAGICRQPTTRYRTPYFLSGKVFIEVKDR